VLQLVSRALLISIVVSAVGGQSGDTLQDVALVPAGNGWVLFDSIR
jgi:hypothetical protein